MRDQDGFFQCQLALTFAGLSHHAVGISEIKLISLRTLD